MDCKKAVKIMMESDPNSNIPEGLLDHFRSCSSCVQIFAEMNSAIENFQRLDREHHSIPVVQDKIMESILKIQDEEQIVPVQEHKMPLFNWIGAGFIILGSIMLFQFSNAFKWLKEVFGGSVEITMGIILGAAVTLYAVVFIATHVRSIGEFFGVGDKSAGKH
jgi:hypothetical protein